MLLRLSTTVKSNERGCQRKGSHPAILIVTVPTQFQPMPLLKRRLPFDDPDWIYELKMDGFRALAVIEHGRAQLLSRNGHPLPAKRWSLLPGACRIFALKPAIHPASAAWQTWLFPRRSERLLCGKPAPGPVRANRRSRR